MKTRLLIISLACLLSANLTVSVTACPPPPCPDCQTWDANTSSCIPYGDCDGGCPDCETCVDCYCECTSDCCEDEDCGDPNCWECVDCNCVSVDVNSVSVDKEFACVGCDVTFTVITDPSGHEDEVSWSAPGGDPNSGTGASFTTQWDTAGTKSATASLCGSSDSNQVTVVEVDSLLPDEGTELDDGDGDPNTKLFVVCIVPPTPSSTLTVTATPNPSVAEEDLPDCWTLTGGTGTGKLTRTVSKNTAGETVITCTCNDSEKETTIWVVRGQVSLPSTQECDGVQADVDLIFTPAAVEDHITDVELDSVVPTGVTNFGSPSGADLTFSQRGDITEWRIDNARWYSNQADHCNDDANWEIEATYEIGGSHNCDTNYDPSAPAVVFTASAALPACMDGAASPTSLWSGAPTFTTTLNGGTGLWETTVAVGTFVRDVQATCWWNVVGGAASQFHDMVRDEEQFHEGQFEGTTSNILNDLWDPQLIMNAVNAGEPYLGATHAASLLAAQNAFNAARIAEENRSAAHLAYPQPRRCAAEAEAKAAAGSSHRVAMPCTYPACP